MTRSRHAVPCALVALAAALSAGTAGRAETWPEVKCARYRESWTEALRRLGTDGLSAEFLRSHEAFLASGCTDQGAVCPRSPRELELANVMTIRAMNAGTASTFLPFGCRR